MALVDDAGQVLFGAGAPGKVEVTNFPFSVPGTNPSALGTIISSSSSSACASDGFAGRISKAFSRKVLPGGGGVFIPFTIPNDQVFVVTSFDWVVTGAPASRIITVSLKLESPSGFNVSSAQSAALADASGVAAASATLGGGIVIKGSNVLCFTAPGDMVVGPVPGLAFGATAQGYFAPDV